MNVHANQHLIYGYFPQHRLADSHSFLISEAFDTHFRSKNNIPCHVAKRALVPPIVRLCPTARKLYLQSKEFSQKFRHVDRICYLHLFTRYSWSVVD